MLDWHTQQAKRIQEHYFRPPPYAYLWLDYNPSGKLLSWCFTFMDMGMCHSLTAKSVTVCPQPDGSFLVNGIAYLTEKDAQDAVFGGHYAHFIQEFHRDLGVSGGMLE